MRRRCHRARKCIHLDSNVSSFHNLCTRNFTFDTIIFFTPKECYSFSNWNFISFRIFLDLGNIPFICRYFAINFLKYSFTVFRILLNTTKILFLYSIFISEIHILDFVYDDFWSLKKRDQTNLNLHTHIYLSEYFSTGTLNPESNVWTES